MYDTSSPHQIQWDLEDSGAIAIITETAEHFSRFDEVHADLPLVTKTWNLDLGDLDKLRASGTGVTDEEIERRRNLAKGSDVATLIYTAGTTGKPKGCILTHANFYELSRNAKAALPDVVNPGTCTVLFITLAHVFARFISVMCIDAGVKVGHQPDTSKLVPAMQSFRPTFLLAVPRVFEKVYNSSEQTAEAGGRGKIFRKAADVAIAHSKALDAGRVPLGLALQFALYDRLVLSKIRAALGGRVEYAVSGSAPLGLRLGHFYRSLGVSILEGYGLTETTAPLTVNLPAGFKIGTVGPPLPGVSIRIADDGEIEGKGIDIFDGYWKNPKATEEAFNDGWFRTGDLGSLDEDGYLTITGRKKEIIVTAGGKNVSPAVLEDPIRADPIIDQVIVVGEQKPFIAALVSLDREMLPAWLKSQGESADLSITDACTNPRSSPRFSARWTRPTSTCRGRSRFASSTFLDTDLTESSGHLTPKLSIKRNVILKDFAGVIEEMYSGAPAEKSDSAAKSDSAEKVTK